MEPALLPPFIGRTMKPYYKTEKDDKVAEIYKLDIPSGGFVFEVVFKRDGWVIDCIACKNRVRAIREAVMFTGV